MLIVLQSKIIWLLSRPVPTVLLLLAANLGQLQNTQDALQLPAEVKFKRGYINSNPAPSDFRSAMLWGIAIADTRVPGHESAVVEIASSQLSCRVDGKDVVLNDDGPKIRGGLYQRMPWFATDRHEPIPIAYSSAGAVELRVGQRPGQIWHFWSFSPRSAIPEGKLEGCTVKVGARISSGALLQIGMDYWRSSTVPYGGGGNNHEAGASDWYFPSTQWQSLTFTDRRGGTGQAPNP